MPRFCAAAMMAATLAFAALPDGVLAQAAPPATKRDPATAPIVDHGPHRVEQGQNYKIIRMHHPRSLEDAVSGPSQMMLKEGAGNIFVLNFTDRTNPESAKQVRWIEEALPVLAKRSSKPLVLLDVIAFDKNTGTNVIDLGFSYSLAMYLQKFNALGKNGERIPFEVGKDALIVPYGALIYGAPGNKGIYKDFSTSLYPPGSTDVQLRSAILSNLVRAVNVSNEAAQRRD